MKCVRAFFSWAFSWLSLPHMSFTDDEITPDECEIRDLIYSYSDVEHLERCLAQTVESSGTEEER